MQTIKITGLGSSGEGVGKIDGLAVFVEGALPGEEILAEIVTAKKNYAVGKLIEIKKPSSERTEPFCPLYKNCGGCQLQHLNYSAQLAYKKQKVIDVIERIGKIFGAEIFDTIGMENPTNYRNKMQFPVGFEKKIICGCYAKNSHKIVDLENCFIQKEV